MFASLFGSTSSFAGRGQALRFVMSSFRDWYRAAEPASSASLEELAQVRELAQEATAFRVGAEDCMALVSPRSDVVDRPGVIDSERPDHAPSYRL